MKVYIHFKSPDAVDDAILRAAIALADNQGIEPGQEREVFIDERVDECDRVANKWFKYGEIVSIELDTDTGYARIIQPNP